MPRQHFSEQERAVHEDNCRSIDEDLALRRQGSLSNYRIGLRLIDERDRKLFHIDAPGKSLGEWTRDRFGFSEDHAKDYIRIGEKFTAEQVRDRDITIKGWVKLGQLKTPELREQVLCALPRDVSDEQITVALRVARRECRRRTGAEALKAAVGAAVASMKGRRSLPPADAEYDPASILRGLRRLQREATGGRVRPGDRSSLLDALDHARAALDAMDRRARDRQAPEPPPEAPINPPHEDPPINPAQPERSAGGPRVPASAGTWGESKAAAPPAFRPDPWARDVIVLHVPFPADDPEPTEAERLACCLIVVLGEALRTAKFAHQLWGRDVSAASDLQLRTVRALEGFRANLREVLPELEKGAALGLDALQADLREGLAARIEDLLPVDVSPDPRGPFLQTVGLSVLDPFDEEDPTELERTLWRLLALIEYTGESFLKWYGLWCRRVPMAADLQYQFQQVLRELGTYATMLILCFGKGADIALEEEREEEALRAVLEQRIAFSESYLVTLGEDRPPPLYVKIGLTADGRPVAISLYTGQVVVALGAQGWGKSHLGVLLCEGATLSLPGLNKLPGPFPVVAFAADWRQGLGNRQMLAGFQKNPCAAQRDYLERCFHFQQGGGNAAYRRGKLLCLPGTAELFRREFAAECERGLEVHEVRFHPTELAHFGYSLLLNCGGEGRYRTRARTVLDTLIAEAEDRLNPRLLRAGLAGSDLDERSRGLMLQQLGLVDRLTSEHEHLSQHLLDRVPLFVLLESRYLPLEMMLPVQVAMMNAMSRPVGDDPHRWFLLDELNKYVVLDLVGEYLLEMAAEVRHRPCSFFFAGQRAGSLPPGLLSLATIVAQFYTGSPQEFKKTQEQVGALGGVSYRDEVRGLKRGQAIVNAARATDGRFTQRGQIVDLRPSYVDPGGETLAAV